MAKTNRLNDYFKASVPSLDAKDKNFMADLNAVAGLEMNLEMFPMILPPGSFEGQLGWIAKFRLGRVSPTTFATPELATECYARCFNLLLWLKSKRDALEAGLVT